MQEYLSLQQMQLGPQPSRHCFRREALTEFNLSIYIHHQLPFTYFIDILTLFVSDIIIWLVS